MHPRAKSVWFALLMGSVVATAGWAQSSTAAKPLSAVLLAEDTAHSIETTALKDKDRLAADLDTRLKTASESLTLLEQKSTALRDDAKVSFHQALDAARSSHKEVCAAIDAVRTATPADWELRRARLADSYRSYAVTALRAEEFAALRAER